MKFASPEPVLSHNHVLTMYNATGIEKALTAIKEGIALSRASDFGESNKRLNATFKL
jgi:hypothetical protein